jgi:hypothetical protein
MRSVLVVVSLGILAAVIASLAACASILGIEEIAPAFGAIDGAAHDASDAGPD